MIRSWLEIAVLFVKELILSAWMVARVVLTPGRRWRPAIVSIPLATTSDVGITLLADMVTLTPGTTSLHVSDDRQTLFVHVIDTDDIEKTVAGIKDGFERKILEVLP